jgi:hypothetical protein
MVTEDERKAPPGGGRDGAIEGQSPGSEDGEKNKPNGGDSQGFDFAEFENLGAAPAAPAPNGSAAPISLVVASWVYTDEHGAPLYKVERLEDGTLGANGKPKKTFRQSKADGRGGWISGAGSMDGVRRVPYRLPELIAAIAAGEVIYVFEGEKCVDLAIKHLGVCATTNSGGAATWPADLNSWFAGADVVPVPDGNAIGQTHALKVARALSGIAKRVRIVTLLGLGEKDDIEQWIAAGGSREGLLELVARAPNYEPPPAEPEQPAQEREPWSAAEEARVRDALRFVSSDCDRNEEWLKILMALHWTGWPCAYEIAHEWSRDCPERYDAAKLDSAWQSFHPDGQGGRAVTLGTLFDLAKKNGWSPAPPDFSDFGSYEEAHASPGSDAGDAGDADDAAGAGGAGNGAGDGGIGSEAGGIAPWPEPKPIGDGLLPVLPFSADFMPPVIMDWVLDIAERKQCPPEYVAIPAIVALGSVLGDKVEIRPKRRDDWANLPNLWGIVIGRPGMLKSPAIDDVLKPLHGLERQARIVFKEAMRVYEIELEQWEAAKKRDKKDDTDLAGPKPEMPTQKRYLTSDTTYEKLGQIMSENPSGVLVHRDEMIYLLRDMDDEKHVSAKQFFITAWNGSSGYTFDRIGRGTLYIERAILSMIGAATPSGVTRYIKGIEDDGFGGDGLFQRFGLAIWPDITANWKNVDNEPNREARDKAYDLFKKFDTLVPMAIGAESDLYGSAPFLRLDDVAETAFVAWRENLERRLRAPDGMQYMLEGHISKYRKLVPVLSLINHLAEDEARGPISGRAMEQALRFVEYLESHAKRIYGCRKATNADAAKAILERIKHNYLGDGFKQREITHDHSWAGLKEEDVVVEGLKLLCATGWIKPETVLPGSQGGRPSIIFRV